MRTNYVLIDYESIQPSDLEPLCCDAFRVMVFVGANQSKIPYETASALQRMGSNAEYVKMSGTGRNSLDFHIAFYMGRIAEQVPASFFHIVSKDKGFDPLIAHLKREKIPAARVESIGEIALLKALKAKTADERARLFAEKLQQPKATKPRTEKTLSNALSAFFRKMLTEQEVTAAVAAMQKQGYISITEGKVSYETTV